VIREANVHYLVWILMVKLQYKLVFSSIINRKICNSIAPRRDVEHRLKNRFHVHNPMEACIIDLYKW
jgi:hypothetical protein